MIEPREDVKEMDEYKPPLEGRRGLLRLDFNENTLGPSPRVLKVLRSLNDEDISAYPEYGSLKGRIADYLEINRNRLLLTNATDEAISAIMQTYVDKKDEVIIPVPTFAMFRFYAQVAGAKITEVLYKRTLRFPTKKLLDRIGKKTRLIILCNPNNPTGTKIKKDDIVKIAEKAKNSIILIDEAYVQFTKETCIDLVDDYDNIVVIQTFSKAFGLGGFRLGYIVSNTKNIRNIRKVLSPYSISSAVIKAASAAIDDIDYINWYTKEVQQAKRFVLEQLKKMRIRTYPTSANFFLAKFGKKSDEIVKKLKEKGILVRDRSSYPLLNGCVRITIGTRKQMQQFVEALKEIK